jgi:hypothetical protein
VKISGASGTFLNASETFPVRQENFPDLPGTFPNHPGTFTELLGRIAKASQIDRAQTPIRLLFLELPCWRATVKSQA